MGARIELHCNGCAAGPVTGGFLRREFRSLDGRRDYGLGRYHFVIDESHAEPGWTMFDYYTGCTYCPICSEELFGPVVNIDAAAEIPDAFDHYATFDV